MIEVEIPDGDFAGWWCRAYADFPVSALRAIESREAGPFLEACDAIIIEHNFPNADGELAATPADVDPYSGLIAAMLAVLDGIQRLPPR